ncbi:MAG: GPP34 family phosphoprotein [Actinomycetia bacterium]|nr:GPP34 family phosphoprotein [Actinomycetes bacterium]
MIIAEALFLLLLDDDSGKLVIGSGWTDMALSAAILAELAAQDFTTFSSEKKRGEGCLVLSGTRSTGDELLDDALQRLTRVEGKPASHAVQALSKGAVDAVAERLVERGFVEQGKGKMLGLVPVPVWSTTDPRYKQGLRQPLEDVLSGAAEPDERSGTIIAILLSMNALNKVFEATDRAHARVLRARAEQIKGGSWANDALNRSLQALYASIAALVAATGIGS